MPKKTMQNLQISSMWADFERGLQGHRVILIPFLILILLSSMVHCLCRPARSTHKSPFFSLQLGFLAPLFRINPDFLTCASLQPLDAMSLILSTGVHNIALKLPIQSPREGASSKPSRTHNRFEAGGRPAACTTEKSRSRAINCKNGKDLFTVVISWWWMKPNWKG